MSTRHIAAAAMSTLMPWWTRTTVVWSSQRSHVYELVVCLQRRDSSATIITSDRIFADDLREDLDLPYLPLPWAADQVAPGFEISEIVRGYRTLTRTGRGPVAAAPDPVLSLVALVPLSHLLLWPAEAVRMSFMSETGAPLLCAGGYARPNQGESVCGVDGQGWERRPSSGH